MATTIWRGHITFGLISIPIRLVRAARSEKVPLRQLYRTAPNIRTRPHEEPPAGPTLVTQRFPAKNASGSRPDVVTNAETADNFAPVRHVAAAHEQDEILPQAAITKGYEYEKDRFVALDPQELKNLIPKTATEMEIEEFINISDIDPVYFETSYYVHPDEPGKKPYALLYSALRNTQLVAIARFAMHRREHVVIVRGGKSGLIAHTLFFHSEVRADEEYEADPALVGPKELELASKLVKSLAGEFLPQKYRDTYREQLQRLIETKVEAQQGVEVRTSSPKAPGDLIKALEKSLASLKKPPARSDKPERGAARSSLKQRSAGRQKRA